MTAASPQQRVAWIDAARGIGIVLVVYGHVLRSLIAQGVAPADRLHHTADAAIYAFHMPLFFLLSGLFARPAVAGKRAAFVRIRVQAIVYPYILWSLIQGMMAIAASGHVNHEMTWRSLASIPWSPIAQFWFLYTLFLCQLLLILPGRFTLLCIVPIGAIFSFSFPGSWLSISFYNLPFFAAGVYLTAPRATAWLADVDRAAIVAVLAWLAFAALFLLSPHSRVEMFALNWGMGLAGAAGVLALARLVAPHSRLLLELGRASMPIYLLHVIAAAGVRTVCLHFWRSAGELPYTILLTAIGLFVPYAVFRAGERYGFDALLGFSRVRMASARLGSVPSSGIPA